MGRALSLLVVALLIACAPQPAAPTPLPSLSPAPGYGATCVGQTVVQDLSAGQTGSVAVMCTNTGTSAWTRGTATEAALVACCPVGGSAPFPAWATGGARYAQTQSSVAPSATGTFAFSLVVPAGTPPGTYTSYAALVNAASQPIATQVLTFTVHVV